MAGFALGYIAPEKLGRSPIRDNPERNADPTTQKRERASAQDPAPDPAQRRADLAAGLSSAVGQLSNAHRAHDLTEFFKDVTAGEMALMSDLVQKLPENSRRRAWPPLMERWVELDPEAAAAHVKTMRVDQGNAMHALTAAWTLRDPHGVLRWMQHLPWLRRSHMQPTLAATLSRKYHDDPAKGAALWLQSGILKPGSDGEELFAKWAKQEPRAAMAAASSLANTKLRYTLLEGAVKGWAQEDPAAATAWFARISDPKLRGEAAIGLAVGLAGQDVDRSVAFTRSLPEGRARDRTFAAVAGALLYTEHVSQIAGFAGEIAFEPGNEKLLPFYNGWIHADA
ncbi:MAG: hypothetical protein M3463_09200, partial [Verrucomicrobiota bacterium]|nr:hypothetical protein [Verrucomicrobiota bacterium]